ncbi:hypothetical protein AAFC00_000947 [Neodothiora populina]|uniref:DUF8035 domain-containing protein n=1 Tax=Neodothiora populina TaxID=2781224 RepID=A0ABR3PM98_9PEZI
MSRRYPVADVYEDRERDFYARPRTERKYDDLEVDLTRSTRYPDRPATVLSDRRGERPGRTPDFLREDYGKTSAGQLVPVRAERDDWDTYSRRGPPERTERVERDELVVRERDRPRERPPPPREYDQEEIIYRRGDREPPAPVRQREREEIDINIRREDLPREPPARKVVEREDIIFRRGEGDRRPLRSEPPRSEVDREEISFRRREETRSPPARSERGVEREELIIRDRSIPPPRRRSLGPVAREREEFVFRRREPSPPPPPRDDLREEIIIRRRERSPPREPSPEPIRTPSPEPMPEPIIRPPIVQEIITHHRHIDHGVERAREPTPPPPPPSPPPPVRDESLEIEIRRRGTRNGERFNEDIIIDRDRSEHPRGRGEKEVEITRRRSMSAMRAPKLKKDMWTEVTKDLVSKEAIDEMGYDYEETPDFFYVMDYLRYEDVLQLVELSESIRRERRERIREIQWEREELERFAPPKSRSRYDERVYERETDYYRRRG